MSKNRDNRNQNTPLAPKVEAPPPIIEQKGPPPGGRCDCCGQLVPDPGAVPKHLHCPSCAGGIGIERWHRRVSGTLIKRCYKCNKCGFDWTIDVREYEEPLRIQYQEITIQTRQP